MFKKTVNMKQPVTGRNVKKLKARVRQFSAGKKVFRGVWVQISTGTPIIVRFTRGFPLFLQTNF
jgi:hypothetical protein